MSTHTEPNDDHALQVELVKCSMKPAYFINVYCKLYDNVATEWLPFRLWPMQEDALAAIHGNRRIVILKARQLGMTWLALAYILWQMIFRPIAKPLVFSRTEEDAMYLLGDERLRGMHRQLPTWMIHAMNVTSEGDASRTWKMMNDSVAHAFPPNRGDSYTGTIALADEFDILTDKEQNQLLRSVKPTVDAGGKFVMLSRVDKENANSVFKKTFLLAQENKNGWTAVFLPWNARPDRDEAWYQDQWQQAQSMPSPEDFMWEQYPASIQQSLAPKALNKRIPAKWLEQCYVDMAPLETAAGMPAIPDLVIYKAPEPGRRYVISGDPAEGNPTSDDSASVILDRDTGEEVAMMAGKIEPTTFADYLNQIGRWYNEAAVLVERNNHGAAVLGWLAEHSELEILKGHDDRLGWLSSQKGKALLYSACAEAFRDKQVILHSFVTFNQLSAIEGNTLRAPSKERDDCADAFALAAAAPPVSVYESRGLLTIGA